MTRRSPKFLWMNGAIVPWAEATVHVSALGWSTMAAVFEGIKAYWNDEQSELYALQFRQHYDRFCQSMAFQRMRSRWTADELAEASIELLRANGTREDTQIRPLAYFGDATWFGAQDDCRTDVVITTAPFASVLGRGAAIRACVSSWTRISDSVLPPRVKCISNYQNSRLALGEALRHGCDQPLLLNAQGKVTEAPAACVFVVRDGVAITPSITSGILESITRRTILQLCHEVLRIPTQEREIDRTELYVADEIFLCGTGAEVTPVGEIDGYVVGDGRMGPLTTAIEHTFHDMVRGRTLQELGWVERVGVRQLARA